MALIRSSARLWAKTSRHNFGYVAGVGAEYAMTEALSFKAEYLYTDYKSRTSPVGTVSPTDSYKSDPSSHLFRVGVNYSF